MNLKSSKKPVFLRNTIIILAATVIVYFLARSFIPDRQFRNVVLISIDTCRADHLSCYGYEAETTPNIDRLAEDGILFKRAITPTPWTLPSHTSMLTGTNPVYHGVHDNDERVFHPH